MIRRRMPQPLLFALLIPMVAGSIAVAAQNEPLAFGDDPRIDEAGLDMQVFATGLHYPYGIIDLPDGSVLVATSDPTGASFFQSNGGLLRLADEDGDGVADDAGIMLATDIPGPMVTVRRANDLIFASSARVAEEKISIYRGGPDWTEPLEPLGSIDFSFAGAEHQTYALAILPHDEDATSYDLLFNIGGNSNTRPGGLRVDVSGLTSGTLYDSTVYMVTVTDDGSRVSVSEPVLVATGLRNAAALEIDRNSGDLIIADMGIDLPKDRWTSLSPDEINIIPAAEIGVEVHDFGFPSTYMLYETGEMKGSKGDLPWIGFLPVEGSESEGLTSLAQMPIGFPESLRDGYAAGFHGQTERVGNDNEENPVLWVDLETKEQFELISNDNPGAGHFNSLWPTEDALYVGDLCSTGLLTSMEPCGVIYRITADG